MSDNNVDNNVVENVVEDVKEVENKSVMPPPITNPEPVDPKDTPKVNKKLSAMSKNTKEKQKNRKLSKPTVRSVSRAPSLNINPMYLLGIIGVIIAGASLWYQRKSFLKEEEEQRSDDPVQSTGGDPEAIKKSPPKKEKKQHFDPWEWKREHQQTGMFPGNYDFD